MSKINRSQQEKTEQAFYAVGASFLGVVLMLYLLYKMFPISLGRFLMPCMFLKLTGLYCPGCGGTRAVAALLKGKWLLSFFYHPIVYGNPFHPAYQPRKNTGRHALPGRLSLDCPWACGG